MRNLWKLCRIVCVFGALLLSAGCKEILYSNLTETDANEMTAILVASGISVSRSRDKDGNYEISVGTEEIAAAVTLLREEGLPRKRFVSMNEIFSAEGLVGSPFEDRVRYVYALEQKLTENLISINGIRDARVTVSVPEPQRFGPQVNSGASSSIILHHEPDFEIQNALPKVKTLVANAVQGLEYDDVVVVVFPTGGPIVVPAPLDASGAGAAEASPAVSSIFVGEQSSSAAGRIYKYVFLGLIAAYLALSAIRFIVHRMGYRWS